MEGIIYFNGLKKNEENKFQSNCNNSQMSYRVFFFTLAKPLEKNKTKKHKSEIKEKVGVRYFVPFKPEINMQRWAIYPSPVFETIQINKILIPNPALFANRNAPVKKQQQQQKKGSLCSAAA